MLSGFWSLVSIKSSARCGNRPSIMLSGLWSLVSFNLHDHNLPRTPCNFPPLRRHEARQPEDAELVGNDRIILAVGLRELAVDPEVGELLTVTAAAAGLEALAGDGGAKGKLSGKLLRVHVCRPRIGLRP